jgi:hypothetical protein
MQRGMLSSCCGSRSPPVAPVILPVNLSTFCHFSAFCPLTMSGCRPSVRAIVVTWVGKT